MPEVKVEVFTKEERDVLKLAVQSAKGGIGRALGKASFDLVKQGLKRQVEVLDAIVGKVDKL